jgi:hypothetical protein
MENDVPEEPEAPAEATGGVQTDEMVEEEAESEAAGDKEDAADVQDDGKKGLGKLLFKRKGDIKAPPENPVYEKSVDDLQGTEKPQP